MSQNTINKADAAETSTQETRGFNQRRIAIFEPHPDFATNPSLVCLSEALARSGAQVDVLMPSSDQFPAPGRSMTRYPFPHHLSLSLWSGSIRSTLGGWRQVIRHVFSRRTIDRLFARNRYDLIIGINSEGLIEGRRYAKRFSVPLAYLSFEIFFRDELSSPYELRQKAQECVASHFADLVIIQDKCRAQLLATENDIPLDRFAYLPVSPGGSSGVPKSDYLRKQFNLSETQIIVLHSGSLASWTYADELLQSVGTWPADFALVIHTRYRPTNTDRYAKMIREASRANVFLSTEPLPQSEYEQLVASADIGLVLYKPIPPSPYTQKNIQHIGLASGKFSFYVKYGLPVISIGQQTYADLLKEYDFGENLASFEAMPAALQRVRSGYAHHQAEARRLFSEKLDFDILWPSLAAKLLEVMK